MYVCTHACTHTQRHVYIYTGISINIYMMVRSYNISLIRQLDEKNTWHLLGRVNRERLTPKNVCIGLTYLISSVCLYKEIYEKMSMFHMIQIYLTLCILNINPSMPEEQQKEQYTLTKQL